MEFGPNRHMCNSFSATPTSLLTRSQVTLTDADEILRTTTVQVGTQGVRFGGLLCRADQVVVIPASRHLNPATNHRSERQYANAKRFQLTAVRVTTGLQDCRYAVHLLWRFRRGQPFIQTTNL